MKFYPILLAGLLLLAGCADTREPNTEASEQSAPCPGHFHVTLLVAHGDEIIPFFSEPADLDSRSPVAGIHMHGDDGIIHIHPSQIACYSLAATLHAVGVQVGDDKLEVDGDVRTGTVAIDIQYWGAEWQSVDPAVRLDTVPDAARVLLMVNPPADVRDLREQVPNIPAQYQST